MKKLIILDFNRTLYDTDNKKMIVGALDFLKNYSNKYSLALIAKVDTKRVKLIEDLNIRKYFSYIKLVSEKILSLYTGCFSHLEINQQIRSQ